MIKFIKKGYKIKEKFLNFYSTYPYLDFEQTIEFYAIFGGVEELIELELFDDIFSVVRDTMQNRFDMLQNLITPSYLKEPPYNRLLYHLAKGDSKIVSAYYKSKLGEQSGNEIVQELEELKVLQIEKSRENPLKIHPKHKLKKELRSYIIQDKARFTKPFYRFWFAFVIPYIDELQAGRVDEFLDNFQNHYEKLRSYIFEQLSLEVLQVYYKNNPLISSGSYWDKKSEFDILALGTNGKIILAECKYKDRKVCKNELNKLKQKAIRSGIKVDKFVVFSKSGFSNELIASKPKDTLLFDLNDIKSLLII
jgi:hypothetical protein